MITKLINTTKKILAGTTALLISTASLFVFAPVIAHAAVDTCTWDGSASTSWNTAANWSCGTDGEAVPGAGDSLVFPYGAGITNKTLNNNISAGTSFASITFSGTKNSEIDYTISGNAIALTTGMTNSSTLTYPEISIDIALSSDVTFNTTGMIILSGALSGSGDITKTGTNQMVMDGSSTYTGETFINAGSISIGRTDALGASSSGTTIADGGMLQVQVIESQKNGSIAEPLTINAANYGSFGQNPTGAIFVSAVCGQSLCEDSNIKFTGAIELGAAVEIDGYGTATIKGPLSGQTIQLFEGTLLKLVVDSSDNTSNTANGTIDIPKVTTKYKANSPNSSIVLSKNETGIITGTYLSVTANYASTIKGTGTLKEDIYVGDLATLAPGMSPGCLTAGGDLTIYGTYQVEIGGDKPCSGYDQTKVTGTVTLTNPSSSSTKGTLTASIVNDYKLTAGQQFTIIDNSGKDKVEGTFKNLKEGATFKTKSGTVLKVSYKGGTGNDVVLTVVTVGAPDTGFGLLLNNPLAILSASVLAAGAILLMSKRMSFAGVKVRSTRSRSIRKSRR